METLVRLGSLLSPTFFSILAGLSLTVAALLFVAGRHNAAIMRVERVKLSRLEPIEYRGASYLVLAFGWSIVGLIVSFIFMAIGISVSWGSVIAICLLLICLLFTLCFLYAGGSILLSAVTNQKEELTRWFFPATRHVDSLIVWFGDLIAIWLFVQPWLPRIDIRIGLVKKVGEDSIQAISDHDKSKAAEEMEKLQHKIAEYETRLTLKQREKLGEERRMVEEIMDLYS